MRNLFLLILVVTVLPLQISGQDTLKLSANRFLPDYMKVQFAGNIGFISLGTGYSFLHSHLQTSLFYSYIPKGIEGENINTVSLKNSLSFLSLDMKPNYSISPYLGFGVAYSGFKPLQTLVYMGIRLYRSSHGFFKGEDVYFEVGTTGLYINYVVNNEAIKVNSILNYSIGMSFYFKDYKK
jgi:hypothetical protein